MRSFEILFDEGEASPIDDAAYAPYGRLGFPQPTPERPWIYSNFVQSLDGIVSFRGYHASGADISQSSEDRWLMDLLRAHADAVLVGVNTLIDETNLRGKEKRGPVFRIMAPEVRELRRKLGRAREKNVVVTGSGNIDLSAYRCFDCEHVDPIVLTSRAGAARLARRSANPGLQIIAAGEEAVDLPEAMQLLQRNFEIRYLLCEGGPTLYASMSRAGLIDEKFLTVAPIEVGEFVPDDQPRTPEELATPKFTTVRPTVFFGSGFTKETASRWRWISSRRVGDHEFNRYRIVRA
ncbi:MAG TPA: dihydrofolate reductase family protein [Terriglobales bacterium]|nr:dihydrofolate reductase family protein [Terriglobales bacterium]